MGNNPSFSKNGDNLDMPPGVEIKAGDIPVAEPAMFCSCGKLVNPLLQFPPESVVY